MPLRAVKCRQTPALLAKTEAAANLMLRAAKTAPAQCAEEKKTKISRQVKYKTQKRGRQ